LLKVRAKITFIPNSVKDKSKPILTGKYAFRPNHKFNFYKDGFFIGQVMLNRDDAIYFGDVRVVEVWFIDEFGVLRDNLKVGTKWELKSLRNLVANGEVLEILEE